MDNIEIDGNFLSVLQRKRKPLLIDGRIYTKYKGYKWLSEGGYSIEYCKEYFTFFKDSQKHREGDKPAVIWKEDGKEWYKNGQRHREGDEPAVIWESGSKRWYKNDKLHREGDEPAVICSDGSMRWFKDGKEIVK